MDTKGIGNDLAFLGQSLTPSLLVRSANPRHDRPRRSKRQTVGGYRPRKLGGEIWAEMDRRQALLGIAEKLPKEIGTSTPIN
jgi:hypothetical protein